MNRLALLSGLLLLGVSGPVLAAASPLTVVKSLTVVSDPLNELLPKAVPGAYLDYTAVVTNPAANTLFPVKALVYVDAVPPRTSLMVTDLGSSGGGPVAFSDGSLLGLGLGGSGLTYGFTSLSSTADQLDFSNDGGTTWTYVPVPDANGCDASVTAVRVRFTGTQATGSAFSLRFRVRVR